MTFGKKRFEFFNCSLKKRLAGLNYYYVGVDQEKNLGQLCLPLDVGLRIV
jgi:hypothetical protein